ncbi:MAG: DUF2383 domain-containing protein [Clostridia bacterium]|nr:DUF2383 domain-containing protein [Clostridia bacterium]MBR6185649.1 DUF2383 domain-containing protein [Clostridia bacterium]
MIEQDTIRLLRECDEGVKMGVASIEDVLDRVRSQALEKRLTDCKTEHQALGTELQQLLNRYGDEGKDPPAMATAMSGLMTKMKLMVHDSDAEIADLMTDGCNMGVKSLSRFLNQYAAADEASKGVAKRLIALEETLAVDLRGYL